MRPTNSVGRVANPQQKKSLICVEAISSAMPLVKPRTTGRGMNFTAWPRPVTASTSRMTPDAMPNAIASGKATTPTVRPATTSEASVCRS
jgi:hypothetical protein